MIKKLIILTILILRLLNFVNGQSYSVDQLKADLLFYRSKLEQNHPNQNLYCLKADFNDYFDSLNSIINQPLNELEFYRIITLTSQKLQDGHTLILPSNKTILFHNEKSKFIPYQIGIFNNELYIKINCSRNKIIPNGSKILSINGISYQQIIKQLSDRQVRDGKNISYTYWILDNYFREYYSYIFGHPDIFTIEYLKNGEILQTTVPALSKDSIYIYRAENYPLIHFDNKSGNGITLKIDTNNSYALLKIRDFHNDVLKKEYHQNFNKTIKKYFKEIIHSKTDNLILDLRNNQGGDVKNGVLLLSFLMEKPFKVVNEYNCLKSGKQSKCKGPSLGFHQPNMKQFKGKLYVMVNGGSFSNSVIVASCLKAYNRAIFVGSETGGNPNVIAGYTKDYELPNTKIRVEIPTKQFVLTTKEINNGKGLIPDYLVIENIIDYLNQIDTTLNFTINLIK